MKSRLAAVGRLLRPYVVREVAPDGRTFHGYGGRVARYWTRWGASRVARQLQDWFDYCNDRQQIPKSERFRFVVQFRRKGV